MPRLAAVSTMAILMGALPCASISALADPNQSLLTTYEQGGLRQLDVELGTSKQPGQPSADATMVGLGYGVTDDWFSEAYISYSRDGAATTFDSAALQNTIVLSQGRYPVDVGLYTELEYERDRTAGDQASFGPLLQTEFGLTTANLNFVFHRNYRADFSNSMQLAYQWQVKRRTSASLEVGIQGFGELGQWDHWAAQNQQQHRIGPVLLGKIAWDEQHVLHYNAGLLFDVLDRQSTTTFRLQAIYGF